MNAEQWEDRTCDYLFQAASALALVGPSVSQHLVQRLRKRTVGTYREEAMVKAKNQYCQKCSRIFVPLVNCKVDFYSKNATRRRVRYVCECAATQTIEDVQRDPSQSTRTQKNTRRHTRAPATGKKLDDDVDMMGSNNATRQQKNTRRHTRAPATDKKLVDGDIDMADSNNGRQKNPRKEEGGASSSSVAAACSPIAAISGEGPVPELRTLQPARKKRVVNAPATGSQCAPGGVRALHVENRRTEPEASKDTGAKDGTLRPGGSDAVKREAGQSGAAERSKKKRKPNAQASRYDALRNILGGANPKMGGLGNL